MLNLSINSNEHTTRSNYFHVVIPIRKLYLLRRAVCILRFIETYPFLQQYRYNPPPPVAGVDILTHTCNIHTSKALLGGSLHHVLFALYTHSQSIRPTDTLWSTSCRITDNIYFYIACVPVQDVPILILSLVCVDSGSTWLVYNTLYIFLCAMTAWPMCLCGVMDSALDFESNGCGFESRQRQYYVCEHRIHWCVYNTLYIFFFSCVPVQTVICVNHITIHDTSFSSESVTCVLAYQCIHCVLSVWPSG